ncbi:N-terminal glutamine amidase-domain-containing protein [Rhizoctonia solani]|nr:N-terminal glutamine amidase-domain-containing protein [Rhizoctonia solani]
MSTPLDPVVEKLILELNTPYTSCYCEENVYLACQALIEVDAPSLENIYAVFLSNPTKTILIWGQKAAQHKMDIGCPVVWDYHVIMVLVAAANENEPDQTVADRTYIVDFDSMLGTLVSWKDYTSRTFQSHLFECGIFDPTLQSMFRVIPASQYIDQFASDRSHMMKLNAEGIMQYAMLPPSYDVIVGPGAGARGVTNNLMDEFVRMPGEGVPGSRLLGMDDFLSLHWIHIQADGHLGDHGVSELLPN